MDDIYCLHSCHFRAVSQFSYIILMLKCEKKKDDTSIKAMWIMRNIKKTIHPKLPLFQHDDKHEQALAGLANNRRVLVMLCGINVRLYLELSFTFRFI